MHPVFSSRNGLLLYLAAWVPVGLMLTLIVSVTGRLSWPQTMSLTAPVTLLLAFVCLAPWYLCRALPLRSTRPVKLIVSQLAAAMIATAIVMIVATHLLFPALGRVFPKLLHAYSAISPVLAGMVDLLYLFSIAIYYVVLAIESSRHAELLSRESELKAIKAQVNPHFLFNSLNSISALTTVDPAKAREMCIRLSDFLRASLRLGERASIPFGEELALTRSYLDVEQVRFGSRLRVSQDFDPVCSDIEVPPLLVQPLVENAIKHGIATLSDGGEIAIAGKRLRDSMRVTIENPFDPDAPTARRNGFGLASVRKRLQARYGAAARLDVQIEQNRYRAVLSLPCDPAEEAHEA
jgi:two-component system, LytTR family, sensor histidine kinase AlgZ